jgi:TonB family protein
MFGAGSRGGGGNSREIPLSALVPEQRLVAPDLRNLNFRLPQSALPGMGAASEGKEGAKGTKGERGGGGAAGYGGGMATALPDGLGVRGAANGPQISFDIVPPSNTRTRKSGEVKPVRVVLGDATVAGGGEAEGLRLPASPKRVGLSVEATVEPDLASAMEQYLRLFLSRMRRTAFEAVPDSRGLGGGGEVVLVAEIGRIGRLQRTSIQTSSSNSQLDTAALQLLRQTPAIQALPDRYVPDSLSVKVIVRYR